jgi:hypothetical protein
MHEIDMKKMCSNLCKSEVLASGGDGCEDLLAECLVTLIFGKIKLYSIVSPKIDELEGDSTYG